jgi:hypothetical protein
MNYVKTIESYGSGSGKCAKKVVIAESGQLWSMLNIILF